MQELKGEVKEFLDLPLGGQDMTQRPGKCQML